MKAFFTGDVINYLVYHKYEKGTVFSKDYTNIKVDKFKKNISGEPLELIRKLFQLALFQTKFSSSNIRSKNDNED